uniref:Uncharacterized protein n=1 Tax=Chromera velia CCMP2878 TaxID=1169474 RepID=A0A0G4HZW2_9ALVE|eukprot:Cvel_34164.t1-p1 / transcript=Cvel_34164.t1 / gene=Cvel_34164 / organism=Chromera_velia_CCMP2878 / gene_product=P2X purinoceptor 4, putative / transcript_product=P2X purinoceptor 4, putative / location=Cvel_scaffold5770:1316-2752(+) / protein_length=479 / sequence_SO=supercontig / SO=protein_coding / is_pseudo=false
MNQTTIFISFENPPVKRKVYNAVRTHFRRGKSSSSKLNAVTEGRSLESGLPPETERKTSEKGGREGRMDLLQQDSDDLLSYLTKRRVTIRDRTLGITNRLIQVFLVAFIIIWVVILNDGYKKFQLTEGASAVQVSGSVVGQSIGHTRKRVFAADEIVYPPLENGDVFMTTRYETVPQKRGVCEDPARPCTSDKDCLKDGECSKTGLCKEPSWCADGEATVFSLPSSKLKLWVKSAIEFEQLNANQLFQNVGMDEKKKGGAIKKFEEKVSEAVGGNPLFQGGGGGGGEKSKEGEGLLPGVFTVEQLLGMCAPPVLFEEVSLLGAMVEIGIRWECQMGHSCSPTFSARRTDSLLRPDAIGFSFVQVLPDSSDPQKRMKITRTGIRLIFRTFGKGWKFSFTQLVFVLSTALALLSIAPFITDKIMLHLMPEKSKYRPLKEKTSLTTQELDEKARRDLTNLGRGRDEESVRLTAAGDDFDDDG